MSTLLIILIIITSTFLILVASLQSSKKEGLGNSLGSMGAHQIIGVKKTSDLLEQITWGLLIGLFILSLGSSFFLKKRTTQFFVSPNLERVQQDLLTEPMTEDSLNVNPTNPDSVAK
ncbi:MAG: preprotein translocase subunit SecG [Candidatus Amoebophilus sp. 36-38]|nr:MAG: preprotein translocase subunit SecG [Candidatus Amoebophilus sp. 36-38]